MSQPKPVQKRNVIVIGKTGTGKSTVANKIAGYGNFDVFHTSQSGTPKVSHCETTMDDPETNVRYDFKVIDTIGLFDHRLSLYHKIMNKEIMDRIKVYLNDVIPEGITLVMFVFRKGRFTQEEEDTFNYITENFRNDISEISTLVITNCENDDDEGRQDIIEDFTKSQRATANFMKKGIHAVGFPDIQKVKQKLRAAFQEDIEKDTEKLRDLVKKADEMRLGKKLFEPTIWEMASSCIIL
ncbi:immune-associated nucleotide-binding protein 3 [Exaiptasia diaphana]|uniref:AIG1-type G domain-containing protein n=1 Tax=Exaiptasia diaphana TaxID=2652724 RepID=A0A913XY27_EXADI|nr:immune-associated nucleotide-binding protein 3 [Exaiptasia diaphana]